MREFLNKLFTSECNAFMDNLPDNCIKLTVTSPPYDKLRLYNGFTFDFERTAKNLFRITETGSVLVWVVGDQTVKGSETGSSFKQALFFMSLGFKLHDTMIYAKLNYIPQTHNRYEQEFEYMFVFVKGKVRTFNPIMVKSRTAGTAQNLSCKGYGFKEGSFRRRAENTVIKDLKVPGNIFYYACGASGKNHEAVFPNKLAADHIFTWSNESDIVFDPFSGSGTTCEEAKKANRCFIGCDISEQYTKDAQEIIDRVVGFKDWSCLF